MKRLDEDERSYYEEEARRERYERQRKHRECTPEQCFCKEPVQKYHCFTCNVDFDESKLKTVYTQSEGRTVVDSVVHEECGTDEFVEIEEGNDDTQSC